MSLLHSEPRMSDREKVCATAWLKAAIDDEDPVQAAYWQAQGLAARVARVAPGEEIAEPPVPEPKRRKATCDLCRSADCRDSGCLL